MYTVAVASVAAVVFFICYHDHFYPLPYNDGKTKYQYVVTALDRLHNESKGTKKKVKL